MKINITNKNWKWPKDNVNWIRTILTKKTQKRILVFMILGSLLTSYCNLEKSCSENTNLLYDSHLMKQEKFILIILFIKICTEWIYFVNRLAVEGSDSIQFWAFLCFLVSSGFFLWNTVDAFFLVHVHPVVWFVDTSTAHVFNWC